MLTNDEISNRISRILTAKLGTGAHRIDDRARFDEDLRVSSLDMVEAIMLLEDEFRIEISDSDADILHTVGDWIVLVRAKIPPSPASTGMHAMDKAGVE